MACACCLRACDHPCCSGKGADGHSRGRVAAAAHATSFAAARQVSVTATPYDASASFFWRLLRFCSVSDVTSHHNFVQICQSSHQSCLRRKGAASMILTSFRCSSALDFNVPGGIRAAHAARNRQQGGRRRGGRVGSRGWGGIDVENVRLFQHFIINKSACRTPQRLRQLPGKPPIPPIMLCSALISGMPFLPLICFIICSRLKAAR